MSPLKGLKVVELARILAGPLIGQTLADLGAEVTKVKVRRATTRAHGGPLSLNKMGLSLQPTFTAATGGKPVCALILKHWRALRPSKHLSKTPTS
jgi:crotonobetainyl-CoA:carnitine CoA-transferase CaiB-like acyl-CoA transferase